MMADVVDVVCIACAIGVFITWIIIMLWIEKRDNEWWNKFIRIRNR